MSETTTYKDALDRVLKMSTVCTIGIDGSALILAYAFNMNKEQVQEDLEAGAKAYHG